MLRNLKKIISNMTLQEKAALCSGAGAWNTVAYPEHGIPSITMTDGPHGLRRQAGAADHLGLNESVPATCFPSASGLACSWDRSLIEQVGVALGEESQAEDVQIILGPGANIKRSPLCGRNFEYYSEDPYLSSQLAIQHIRGVQSQGVGTSLKHYAVNNQETRRFTVNAELDERTLREIYLASFEDAVKEAQPWTVMAAYNKINGEYCSQNRRLLTEILRDEWGFEGMVVSDWGAVSERDKALLAGLDLEMPSSGGMGTAILVNTVTNGTIPEETLDLAAERLLTIFFRAADSKKENASYNKDAHHQLARQIASECMVLLKNEDAILPLAGTGSIAVIGEYAQMPRYQGAGSSRINPTRVDIPLEEMGKAAAGAKLTYARGYALSGAEDRSALIAEAVAAAKQADVAVIFTGTPASSDCEGQDRTHMRLPDDQNALIEAVAAVQKNLVVVLLNGAPVEMPWIGKVKGLLEAYLGGQAMAGAVADILFGVVNPSGKLAESLPEKLGHNPSYINFPGEKDLVQYREGLFVGYRHYDKTGINPQFPFGFGLSYTAFEYSDLQLDKKEMLDTDTLKVTVKVKNVGKRAGKETVQLYVRDVESSMLRPVKELKGFEKVALEPGEAKVVTFALGKRAFATYHVPSKDWYVESGTFEILVGKSSAEIVLFDTVDVTSTQRIGKEYTLDSTLADIMHEPVAAQLIEMITKQMGGMVGDTLGMDMQALLGSIKLRMLVMMGQGTMSPEMLQGLVDAMNAG